MILLVSPFIVLRHIFLPSPTPSVGAIETKGDTGEQIHFRLAGSKGQRTLGGPPSWRGTLRVSLPGTSSLALTGGAFDVRLSQIVPEPLVICSGSLSLKLSDLFQVIENLSDDAPQA